MSPDWLFVSAVAVGHLALFVVVVNVTHALGLAERWMNWIKLLLLAALFAGAGAIGWEFARGPWHSWRWGALAYAAVCLPMALVGIPLGTLARLGRPVPRGIKSRVTETDLAQTLGAGRLTGTGKHAWMLRLPLNESLRLRRVEYEIIVPNLRPELDGLSLVQVTDLHFSPCFDRRFFEAVADEAGAWDPDLMLFTGDLIDHDSAIEWVVPVMSRLRGRLGSYSILGNHDLSHHPASIRRALDRAGFIDLEGLWTCVESDGGTVALGGTSYPWGPRLDAGAMPDADLRIVLSHTPDRFAWAVRSGIDLILAGHNHGGQIRLPLLGPVFMPSLYSRRFDRGFFQSGSTLMHVSQGVAGKHPARYGCPPEVTRFVLRCEATRTVRADRRVHVRESDPLPS
jgi:predicted MPP superfamily phosphohydrolase